MKVLEEKFAKSKELYEQGYTEILIGKKREDSTGVSVSIRLYNPSNNEKTDQINLQFKTTSLCNGYLKKILNVGFKEKSPDDEKQAKIHKDILGLKTKGYDSFFVGATRGNQTSIGVYGSDKMGHKLQAVNMTYVNNTFKKVYKLLKADFYQLESNHSYIDDAMAAENKDGLLDIRRLKISGNSEHSIKEIIRKNNKRKIFDLTAEIKNSEDYRFF